MICVLPGQAYRLGDGRVMYGWLTTTEEQPQICTYWLSEYNWLSFQMTTGTEAGTWFANVLVVIHANLLNANTLFSCLSRALCIILFTAWKSTEDSILRLAFWGLMQSTEKSWGVRFTQDDEYQASFYMRQLLGLSLQSLGRHRPI